MGKGESMKSSSRQDIVDQGLEKYRTHLAGTIIRPPQGNHVATRDAIRHFANGMGDSNPLWLSDDHARRSIYGCIIASPLFLNAISEGQAIVGLPGLISTFVGAEWEWHKIIRVNDAFTVTNVLFDLNDLGRERGDRRFLQTGLLRYENQRGELVGTCKWNMMRSESKLGGKGNRRKGKSSGTPIYRYSEEDLDQIYQAIEAEEIRSAQPRYWEEVKVDDEIKPVVKGPLSLSDMVAWAVGTSWHRIELAHGPKLLHLRKYPALSYIDPDTMVPEPIANSHFLPAAAKILMGSPVPMDLGFQRVCWLGHPVTNWMSDYGCLKRLDARLKAFVRFGDTNWCGGRVVKKWVDKDEHLVEIALSCENQHGDITTTGTAVVALPSKAIDSNSHPQE